MVDLGHWTAISRGIGAPLVGQIARAVFITCLGSCCRPLTATIAGLGILRASANGCRIRKPYSVDATIRQGTRNDSRDSATINLGDGAAIFRGIWSPLILCVVWAAVFCAHGLALVPAIIHLEESRSGTDRGRVRQPIGTITTVLLGTRCLSSPPTFVGLLVGLACADGRWVW